MRHDGIRGKTQMRFIELPTFPSICRRLFSSSFTENAARSNASTASPSFGKRRHNESHSTVSKLITRLVNMRVVKNMTKNGKIARFSSIVVAGNGNGGLGCGHSKHDSASEAVTKAGKLAVRDMQFFNRWQDRTLFHDDYTKYKATKLYVRPAPPSKMLRIIRVL